MATNGTFNQQEQYKNTTTEQYPATSGAAGTSNGGTSSGDLSKDEVGWYFVEQYYTTLSKSPEKLHVSLIIVTLKNKFALTLHSSSTERNPNSFLVLRVAQLQYLLAEL